MSSRHPRIRKSTSASEVLAPSEGRNVPALLAELRRCTRAGDRNLWRTGDLSLALRPIYSISKQASLIAHPRVRLNEAFKTAEAFPPGDRDLSQPFFSHERARKVADKFKGFGLTPVKALHIIATLQNKKAKAIIRHFAQQFQMQVPPMQAAIDVLVNNCHHCDIRDLTPKIPSRSVHLLFFDPPFLRRPGVKTGLVTGTGMARTECDCADEKAALKLTIDILGQAHRLLAPGGALVLCQPSGILDFRLHRAIHDCDLHAEAELFWAKGRTRPGNPRRPYSTELERLLILVPKGQRATCWGKPLHSDLLTFPAVNLVRRQPRSVHVLQKPPELCRFLVTQHSPANGLVVDACGCSGEMALAAIGAGRNWLYCEANRANFEWARQRIMLSSDAATSSAA